MRPDWDYPSEMWIEKAERGAEMEGHLDRVLAGAERPYDALERVVTHFDDVYQQLNGHLKRIGKMQRELDGLTATVATLSRGDWATRDVK